ncbi:hypothetical protein BIV57_03550 [Mangrovactinospora gilvigrisea]|uniref:RNA polymerase sigma-70 region 4 domain-containing protein n=1 Tax=Mangrovactinospora gilvigrisea TaxID=1428644 RepID=A0A1J7CGN7_9ACTN|nr:sigma factor-like helix-turn-helix DNA-binding protein [Mangrovactinospora gilvigrisea]OIV38826.1 hypothetical protein BIV57_03550 [Mangrovactinospora gilvigrisea]
MSSPPRRPGLPAEPAEPAEEFRAFVAGAAPRLLHVAELLTGDRAVARAVLRGALTRTWLSWPALRGGDPYAHARQQLLGGYTRRVPGLWLRARTPRRIRPRGEPTGLAGSAALAGLSARERTVAVLRYFENLDVQATAAALGMQPEQVERLAESAVRAMLPDRAPAAGPRLGLVG